MIRGSTYQYHIIIYWHDIMGALFHRILAGQGPGEALVLDFMHKPAEFSTMENLGKVRRGIGFRGL